MRSTTLPIHALLPALLLAAGMVAALSLAGCQTDSTGKPVVQAAAPEPVSHEQAALDCWMATEHGRADLPLDKRADVVDACIKAKMAGEPLPAAVTGKPKGKAKDKSKTKAKTKPKKKKPKSAEPKTPPKPKA